MRDGYKQENSGAGAIQIVGDHNTINHHTHSHTHTGPLHAHGPVFVQTAVVHQDLAFALQAPPAPPARQGRQGTKARTHHEITPAQRDMLALMRPLPKPVRVDVLIWMRFEFGTSLVMDLDPRELYRLRTHVLGVHRSGG